MNKKMTLPNREVKPSMEEKRPSDEHVFPLTWYAITWSRALQQRPIKRRMVGRDFVLFRDAHGRPHCVGAYCSHRGADLSLGRCVNGTLQCAYHGWQFTGEGECTTIPAHPDRPIPAFAHISGYPIQEKAGLLWVYPEAKNNPHAEDDEIPKLHVFPQLLDSNFTLAPYDELWQAHLTRVVESVLDVSHLAFVHKKTIGKRVPEMVHGLQFDVPNADTIVIKNGGGLLEYRYPQQWILQPTKESKVQFINYVTFTPIDSAQTQIFGYAGRTFARFIPGLNHIFSRYSRRILREDQVVVESQHPRPIPEALRMEAHVPADGPQVRFRQRWFEFLSSGEAKITV